MIFYLPLISLNKNVLSHSWDILMFPDLLDNLVIRFTAFRLHPVLFKTWKKLRIIKIIKNLINKSVLLMEKLIGNWIFFISLYLLIYLTYSMKIYKTFNELMMMDKNYSKNVKSVYRNKCEFYVLIDRIFVPQFSEPIRIIGKHKVSI